MRRILLGLVCSGMCIQTVAAQSLTRQSKPDRSQAYQMRSEFSRFANSVQKTIEQGTAVARNNKERQDFRTLEFLLRDLNKSINSGDWAKAAQLQDKMKVALHRGGIVSSDAPRRKAEEERIQRERDRAQRERHHREQMSQRSQQHQELMNRLYSPR